jgi:uncharacterized caspase-like protein/Tfp pilus assembly protein PilF
MMAILSSLRTSSTIRWTASLILLIASATVAGAQDSRRIERIENKQTSLQGSGRWALVVGVDAYQNKDIVPLKGAAADAKAIAAALIKYADFPEKQVVLLTTEGALKPTGLTIEEKLLEIRNAAKPDDLMLFFFAGHGIEAEGERYLLTYEANIASGATLRRTAYAVTELMRAMENMPVAHRIVMVDACRDNPLASSTGKNITSESFAQAFVFKPGEERGVRATFLSASQGQAAYEWSEKGRGYFSYFVERALAGDPDAVRFGKVTLNSLADYLGELVSRAVREGKGKEQKPYAEIKGESGFELVPTQQLAASAKAPAPPSAPATRRIYGVVKDSDNEPLNGVGLTVSWVQSGGRGGAGGARQQAEAKTDEDGFFTIEVPADATVAVATRHPTFLARTASQPPTDSSKLRLFLVRSQSASPEKGVVVASATQPVQPPPLKPAPTPAIATPAPVAPARVTPPPPPAPPPVPAATPPPATPARVTPPPPKPVPPTLPPVSAATPRPAPMVAEAPAPAKVLPPPPATSAGSAEKVLKAPIPSPTPEIAAETSLPLAPPAPPSPAQEFAKVAYLSFVAEDFVSAEASARAALDQQADQAQAQGVLASALAVEGVNRNDQARLEQALRIAEGALKVDSNQALAHNALGLVMLSKGDMAAAQRAFSAAAALDARLSAPNSNLAYVYFSQKKYKEAEASYRAAIRANPEAAVPYNGLAQVLIALNKSGDAAKAVGEAISKYEQRDQYLGLFYVNLAVARYQQGKRSAALEAVSRAKSLGVSSNPAYEIIEKAPSKKR